jgi:glycosyltransferase involved in cell wall biosynthesis
LNASDLPALPFAFFADQRGSERNSAYDRQPTERLRSTGHHNKIMVSAIIPARNEEASIARAVESVAAQPEIAEVIVVDDQSTDRTAAILADRAARIPTLRILQTHALPPGWVGKNYAVALGADVAHADWLLFTDADTCHLPGSTRRALADAVEHNAVLVSYSPEQELGSFWERALIPFVYCRLSAKFSYARVNNTKLPDAAANGQFLLILREVYQKVGGHAAIAGEVLEDVALARRVKQAGYQIYFSAPLGTVSTRMYRSFPALWQGWTKNLYPLMGGTTKRALLELIEVFPVLEIIVLLLLWALLPGTYRPPLLLLAALLLLAISRRCARFAQALYRNLYPMSYIKHHVPGMCLYSAALIASWWKNTRGSVVWKGRSYRSGAQPLAQKPLPQRTQ